jgi:hypothetical protein
MEAVCTACYLIGMAAAGLAIPAAGVGADLGQDAPGVNVSQALESNLISPFPSQLISVPELPRVRLSNTVTPVELPIMMPRPTPLTSVG